MSLAFDFARNALPQPYFSGKLSAMEVAYAHESKTTGLVDFRGQLCDDLRYLVQTRFGVLKEDEKW